MLRVSFVISGCLVAACGGKAVVDPPLAGAGGGDTSTTTGVGGATGGPSAVSVVGSSASGGPDSLCTEACASLASCGGDTGNCDAACEAVQPPCREAHQRWLSCSLGETNTMCGLGPGVVCEPDLREYLECTGAFVGSERCSLASDGSCACTAFLSPGIVYDMACSGDDGCVCRRGDVPIGTCSLGETACGIATGCCAGVYFTGP